MADPRDILKLLQEMHDSKVVNLDSTLRTLLSHPALSQLNAGPSAADAVIAWDGYALVIKGKQSSIEEVTAPASAVKATLLGHLADPMTNNTNKDRAPSVEEVIALASAVKAAMGIIKGKQPSVEEVIALASAVKAATDPTSG